jgi:replicative DNA helicase
MLDTETFERYRAVLHEEDFYDPAYREVYKLICKTYELHKTSSDFLLLSATARDFEYLERYQGGATVFIADILARTPTSSLAPRYYSLMKQKRTRRGAQDLARFVHAASEDESVEVDMIMEQISEKAKELAAHLPTVTHMEKNELIAEVEEEPRKLPIQFPLVNDLLGGGIAEGSLLVIGARPGMGKTTMATNLCAHFLQQDIGFHFFSMEMSRRDILLRTLAAMYDETPDTIRKNIRSILEPMETGFHIETGTSNFTRIYGQILSSPHRVIVIDYFQLISMPSEDGRMNNRVTELEMISRSLKLLAMEHQKHIILLSQLNRDIEKERGKREPQLADLRGSGSLEQDADVVSFLWQPEDTTIGDDPENIAAFFTQGETDQNNRRMHWIFRKNRHGPMGTVYVDFKPEKFLMKQSAEQATGEGQVQLPQQSQANL